MSDDDAVIDDVQLRCVAFELAYDAAGRLSHGLYHVEVLIGVSPAVCPCALCRSRAYPLPSALNV